MNEPLAILRRRAVAAGWRAHVMFFGTATLVVVLDQFTKSLVRANLDIGESWPPDWPVKLTHVTNTGAAFGILQDAGVFLVATTVFGVGAVLTYYLFPAVRHRYVGIALGLVLGGAIGNLIDRLRFGRVTDFIDFPHYPKFNVADSAITIGMVILIAILLFAPQGTDRR